MLYACKGHGQTLPERVHTPSLPVRERERVRKWEGEKVRKRGREREREYLFLKGMTGALAPFSYLA